MTDEEGGIQIRQQIYLEKRLVIENDLQKINNHT
jgi:hypothetical protein